MSNLIITTCLNSTSLKTTHPFDETTRGLVQCISVNSSIEQRISSHCLTLVVNVLLCPRAQLPEAVLPVLRYSLTSTDLYVLMKIKACFETMIAADTHATPNVSTVLLG